MDYESVAGLTLEKPKKCSGCCANKFRISIGNWATTQGILDMKYANICVPEFQQDEAEYIVLENGEEVRLSAHSRPHSIRKRQWSISCQNL